MNEVLELNSEEELKKYFFSIGLSLKFKYADKITSKNANVNLNQLFELAKEKEIDINDWQEFICNELNLN